MTLSTLQRFDGLARASSPVTLSLLLVIVGMVPLQIPQIAPVIPAWALIAVYFWCIHQPNLMPLWAVFLIGLFQDLLSGGHPGISILAFILVHQVVENQRRFFATASFQMLWGVFALVAGVALYVMWLVNSVLNGRLIPVEPVIFQFLTTLAVYPCLAWLFTQAQRTLLKQSR